MVIKSVQPTSFLLFRVETRVSELFQFLPIGQELYKEAVDENLFIAGPIQWHYFGFDGDETKGFTLEICLPVGSVKDDYDGRFHFKRTDPFKCIAAIHEGAWLNIPVTYGRMFDFLKEKKLVPAGVNREVYIHCDLQHVEANTTEILLGIQ